MNCVTENRLGEFRITPHIFANLEHYHLQELFKHFVIVKAEHDYAYDYIRYLGYSQLFSRQPKNVSAPLYQIEIDTSGGNFVLSVAVTR